MLLAETATTDLTASWLQVVLQMGALGLLAYILIYTMPKLMTVLDARLATLLQLQHQEREADRAARHELANVFQKAISDQWANHDHDAEKDREAFERRNQLLEAALKAQTAELRAIMQQMCRYNLPPKP